MTAYMWPRFSESGLVVYRIFVEIDLSEERQVTLNDKPQYAKAVPCSLQTCRILLILFLVTKNIIISCKLQFVDHGH